MILPGLVLLVLVIQDAVPLGELTRDPLAVSGGKVHFGALSNVGIILWTATSAICLFAAPLAREQGGKETTFFLAYGGILTAILGLDDLFMVHEHLWPFVIGLPEIVLILIYGFLTCFYLSYFWKQIRSNDALLLAISLLFFAVSVISDVAFDSDLHKWARLGDDGAKFIGISAWAVFHIDVARQVFIDQRE